MVVTKKSLYKNIIRFSLFLSLFSGQLSAMQEVPAEGHKDQEKREHTHATLPYPMAIFRIS